MKQIISVKNTMTFTMHVLMALVIAVATTFLGGITGWVVGLFFEEPILGILACVGIKGFSMFQIGLFFGFVSCFFKTLVEYKPNR